MFKDFDIRPFKKKKPPSDNSFDTAQEIKALKKIPLRKEFVKKYDNIEAAFKKTAEEQGIKDYDKKIAAKLIKESAPVILELKKYHNRPRPYELDKNLKACQDAVNENKVIPVWPLRAKYAYSIDIER